MTAPLPEKIATEPKAAASDVGRWDASLQLTFEQRRGGTRLTGCSHHGPLYVQKPFYPEGRECAHAYLLHPPGGIVSGDCLEVGVLASKNTSVLLTTPGAARAYRAREKDAMQRQIIRLRAAEGASIEWFPLDTIVYNGACVEVETQVELADDAKCALWEVTCLGLPASDALFTHGQFNQRYQVLQEGRPVFIDGFSLHDNNLAALNGSAGFNQQPVSGFFLMGPFDTPDWENRLTLLRDSPRAIKYQGTASVTHVGDYCVGRYLGDNAERARELFSHWWAMLRPELLGRSASPPRIWLT